MLDRRNFLMAGAAGVSALALRGQTAGEWGGPVIDIHHHWRRQVKSNYDHLDGAGITRALILTDAPQDAEAAAMPKDRFARFTSVNVQRADTLDQNMDTLRKAVMAGSLGFGEMKSRVAADGPEMRRVYALAGELGVPVLIHFQEISQQLSVGTYNTGLDRLPALLKEFPKTLFIGHADNFWANISTEVPTDTAYPTGTVRRGGLSDRMLTDYSNLWADLAATSGRNALARDPEFAADFLKRHQDKVMFGSDCPCADGRGTGQTNPLPLIAGKCVARETLGALKGLCTPEVFRKVTWGNATRLLKLI
ncbi:MAG: amidohydrolase family protein [Acidobacteriota bacterium]